MSKGFIVDLIRVENGFILTLFKFFRFALFRGDEGFGNYSSILLGIYKLELVISLAWKPSLEVTIRQKGYS